MNAQAGITLGIAIATFLAGIVWKVADLSMRFGRISRQIEEYDVKAQAEERKNAAKFTELYNDRNRHATEIARLATTMNNIDAKLEKIDVKLDKIIHGRSA